MISKKIIIYVLIMFSMSPLIYGYACLAGDFFNRADTSDFSSDPNWTESTESSDANWSIRRLQLFQDQFTLGADSQLDFDVEPSMSGVMRFDFSINFSIFTGSNNNVQLWIKDGVTNVLACMMGGDVSSAAYLCYDGTPAWNTILLRSSMNNNDTYNITMIMDFVNGNMAVYINDSYVENQTLRSAATTPDTIYFKGNSGSASFKLYIDDFCINRTQSVAPPIQTQTPTAQIWEFTTNDRNNNSMRISWGTERDHLVEKYIMFTSTDNVSFSNAFNTTVSTKNYTGLSPSTDYYFRMKLFNSTYDIVLSNFTTIVGGSSNQTHNWSTLGVAAPGDSCTPPVLGNWVVTDACLITIDDVIPANIYIQAGNVTIAANITFNSSNQFIFIESGSHYSIAPGGEQK